MRPEQEIAQHLDFYTGAFQNLHLLNAYDYLPFQAPFTPQQGDRIVFFRAGYGKYLEELGSKSPINYGDHIAPYLKRFPPLNRGKDLPEAMECVVSKVEYYSEHTFHKKIYATFCRITVIPKQFIQKECGPITPQQTALLNQPFEFDYFEMNITPPFMILKTHYQCSLELLEKLRVGAKIHVNFIDSEGSSFYAGTVQAISSANSNWENITVQWEDETETTVSAWEIREVEEKTDLWKLCPQVDANIKSATRKKLEAFISGRHFRQLPRFKESTPYQIYLSTVIERLKTRYYRQPEGLACDLRHIIRALKAMIENEGTAALEKIVRDTEQMCKEALQRARQPTTSTSSPPQKQREDQLREEKERELKRQQEEKRKRDEAAREEKLREEQRLRDERARHEERMREERERERIREEERKRKQKEDEERRARDVMVIEDDDLDSELLGLTGGTPKIPKIPKKGGSSSKKEIPQTQPQGDVMANINSFVGDAQHSLPNIPKLARRQSNHSVDEVYTRSPGVVTMSKINDMKDQLKQATTVPAVPQPEIIDLNVEPKEVVVVEEKEKKKKKKKRDRSERGDDDSSRKKKKKKKRKTKEGDVTTGVDVKDGDQRVKFTIKLAPPTPIEPVHPPAPVYHHEPQPEPVHTRPEPVYVHQEPPQPHYEHTMDVDVAPAPSRYEVEEITPNIVHEYPEPVSYQPEKEEYIPPTYQPFSIRKPPVKEPIRAKASPLDEDEDMNGVIVFKDPLNDYDPIRVVFKLFSDDGTIHVEASENSQYDEVNDKKRELWEKRVLQHNSSKEVKKPKRREVLDLSLPIYQAEKTLGLQVRVLDRSIIELLTDTFKHSGTVTHNDSTYDVYSMVDSEKIQSFLEENLFVYQLVRSNINLCCVPTEDSFDSSATTIPFTLCISSNMTEPELLALYQLQEKARDAVQACSSSAALFYHPYPDRCIKVKDMYGFIVSDGLEWYTEGFYAFCCNNEFTCLELAVISDTCMARLSKDSVQFQLV